jgi:hypoxanthine phosphoribosyltransferase
MARLKGAIFSLRDVIVRRGAFDPKLTAELGRLIVWLRNQGVQPVFVGNHPWVAKATDGGTEDLRAVLAKRWGPVPWYIAMHGDMPFKPTAAAMAHVLAQQGWKPHEAIYIGNTDDDMKTAVNGKLLFLNAVWHGEASPHGYQFESPLDVGRFIDCFCLGIDDWFWAIEEGDLKVYALGPFSTMSPQYAQAQQYSTHARETAKHLGGDASFWGRLLAASVYLSGLGDKFDYITSYPGHSTTSAQPVVSEALNILAGSLRKRYLPDLIVRHTTAPKSQTARLQKKEVNPLDQLNTIHLNPSPQKSQKGDVYASPPLRRAKTVLVVDDICTEGNAFEAARAYIENTGAKAICLGWLKTIRRDYNAFAQIPKLKPYEANLLTSAPQRNAYWFNQQIRNEHATADLGDVFDRYYKWQWPRTS